ncbi:MAG TPA: V-type ATP synthase subunit K [Bacilli bacterium]|jgi:V/A-type H+-transporting ATPase subunit K|nr:V-type ATP synthase subunit K [Bacilli bacterium]HHV14867.1 V-type ATP synthase subunit K [Acholeplasmataceae bacterium]HOC97915.1 V-type ATP synthase subunit K [Bacilli bacterium]HOF43335.1 V-type ATP synthase subunit K [Bacilli bacterium]HOH58851.1 V-type ATP synthase subunit K [Bacilli bacterium]
MTLAIIGAALAAVLSGIGSAYGVLIGGRAAAGVVSEKPDLFGRLLVLQALPGTQGIYGFIVAIMVLVQVGILGGTPVALTEAQGWLFFAACMPIAIVGLLSAIFQAKMSVAAIHMTAKQPDASGKGMTMTVLVETYAILALLVSILMVIGIPV